MIALFRLTTGEDVISEFESDDDNITLTNPMLLAVSEKGVQFVPYAFFAKKQEITISSKNVIFSYEPNSQLEDAYRKQTGNVVKASVLDAFN